jgi:hypothetical protein
MNKQSAWGQLNSAQEMKKSHYEGRSTTYEAFGCHIGRRQTPGDLVTIDNQPRWSILLWISGWLNKCRLEEMKDTS